MYLSVLLTYLFIIFNRLIESTKSQKLFFTTLCASKCNFFGNGAFKSNPEYFSPKDMSSQES